jgi:uncharacterized membrane protein (UPF0127 family)
MRRNVTLLARAVLLLSACLLFSCALPDATADSTPATYLPAGVEVVQFGQAKVKLANQVYGLEFAANDQQRARGLMYRTELCAACGMLFDFGQSRHVGMWMKNTNIPLDVAYIDAQGTIINIEQMQPHTLQAHHSDTAVRYAIEMNLGWFAQHKIEAGDSVRFISAMPKN